MSWQTDRNMYPFKTVWSKSDRRLLSRGARDMYGSHSDNNPKSPDAWTTDDSSDAGDAHDDVNGQPEDDENNALVVGIDFGTTYSGAAWATAADFSDGQVNVILSWPGEGREMGKAPTELYYEGDQILWGYDVPRDAEPIRWFKLLLLREEDLAADVRQSEALLRARKMMREAGKTPVDLVADYLREFWKHIQQSIIRARGESVLETMQFNIVLTVPAIWKGYARQAMETAVRQAGMLEDRDAGSTSLTFAPEPEAAGLATLHEAGRKVKKDDVYIICDAGGGTADLISYKVQTVRPLTIAEYVEGSGGLCGGVFIDEAFEMMCKRRLGRHWSRMSPRGIKEMLVDDWELPMKPRFQPGNATREYIVRVPHEAFGNNSKTDSSREPVIKDGRIHFRESDIQSVFDPVFQNIVNLLQGQVAIVRSKGARSIAIVLVGGLGCSPYLHSYLKQAFGRAGIDVLQTGGIKPRTAICRGAVYRGFIAGKSQSLVTWREAAQEEDLPIQVQSTICRSSIGTSCNEFFDASKHDPKDRYFDEDYGCWRAANQMIWYIRKGDDVDKSKPITHNFEKLLEPGNTSFNIYFHECDARDPPSTRTSRVKRLCHVAATVEPKSEALSDFQSKRGHTLKRCNYDLEMIPSGASTEFRVIAGGRSLGAQQANVRFE